MKDVSVVGVMKSGFKDCFKNWWFFLRLGIVSSFTFIVGFFISALISLPFFVFSGSLSEKIKNSFMRLIYGSEVVSIQVAPAIEVKSSIEKVVSLPPVISDFEKFKIVVDKFVKLFVEHPFAVIFAMLGFIVFFISLWFLVKTFSLGFKRIALQVCDKGSSSIGALFSRPGLLVKGIFVSSIKFFIYFLVSLPFLALMVLLYIVVSPISSVIAIILFGFVVIYLVFKMVYSLWFLVDKEVNAIEAIKLSATLKSGALKFFLLFLLFIIISFLSIIWTFLFTGLLGVFIGLLLRFTISIGMLLSIAHLYRGLTMHNRDV